MLNVLKIILSILLLLCLLDMPYGYFQLVRFLAASLAILFQPLIKIALGRTIWNIVDVIVAGFLIMLVIKDYKITAKIKEENKNE